MRSVPLFVLLAVAQAAAGQPSGLVNEQALEELRIAAERAHSDAVLVLHDGVPIAEWYFDQERRPVELMSVLKSIVGLGVGRLLALGLLDSLDQPVYAFYPEWNQGRKREITVRHLLAHTSGLQDVPNAGAEIYPSPDAIRLALAAELSEDPGSAFRYNNKATNLLAGIIEEAYGQRMDQFFVNEFFRPMGIDQYRWYYDPSGTPHAMAGLELHARDLAKFGQLVLDGGLWGGERLVSAGYIAEMLGQSQPHYPPYGLLWWRLPSETRYVLDEARLVELSEAGVARDDVARLRSLVGSTFTARTDLDAALEGALGPGWREALVGLFQGADADDVFRREYDDFVAFYGDGYLGQTLMIVPAHKIVAVRQVRGDNEYDTETDGFIEFKRLVLNLIKN